MPILTGGRGISHGILGIRAVIHIAFMIRAVIIGFIGVLVVIRPGTDAMHWAVVLPLVVALADATRDLVTRRMATGESSLRVVFSTGCLLALAGLATLAWGWQPLRSEDLFWFGLSACAFVVAHFLMVEAFRHGELVAVAPFRYVQIVWTILAGMIFWGEVPEAVVFLGIAIICASGVYIAWREARSRKTRSTAQAR